MGSQIDVPYDSDRYLDPYQKITDADILAQFKKNLTGLRKSGRSQIKFRRARTNLTVGTQKFFSGV